MNILGVVIFAALFWLTARGITDPVCGMKVAPEQAVTKELGGETYYFCSTGCRHAFKAHPDTYQRGNAPAAHRHAGHAPHEGTIR